MCSRLVGEDTCCEEEEDNNNMLEEDLELFTRKTETARYMIHIDEDIKTKFIKREEDCVLNIDLRDSIVEAVKDENTSGVQTQESVQFGTTL